MLDLAEGQMQAVGRVHDVESAVDAMTAYVVDGADGVPQRVGVGDALTPELAGEYAARLADRPEVAELRALRDRPLGRRPYRRRHRRGVLLPVAP